MGSRQQRRTHIDTIEYQQQMLQFLDDKINGDVRHITDKKEAYGYFILLSNSLLGQGPISKIVPHINVKGNIIPLGSDVHHFGLQLMNIRTNVIKVKYRNEVHQLDMSDMWRVLKKYFMVLFPRAQTEALHMSKEEWKYGKKSSGYQFDPTKKL